jgi:hypothetical protein
VIELRDIAFCLDADQLMREQRIRPGTDKARTFSTLVAQIQEVGRPKAIYEVSYIEEKSEDSVVLGGVRFTSRALRRNLDSVERVFPYIATCGTEADAITVPPDDLLQAMWLWTLKEAVLQAARKQLFRHLSTRYRLSQYATMDPGSGDAQVWPIEQQKELFSLFGDVESLIGVRLTSAMLMIPTMSVSGIVFPTETDFNSCQVCHRAVCPNRKAPFSEEVWQATCADEARV